MKARPLFALLAGFVLAVPAAISFRVLAYGPDVEVQNPGEEGLIPSFLINRAGFRLDAASDDGLAVPGLNPSVPAFPLYPVYKSKFLSKKFVGVVIPREFIRGQPDRDMAAAMIREIRMQDGLRLVPHAYKGKLFGIRSDVQVTYVNSTTVGISLSFGGPETVNLGDEFVLGLALKVGRTETNLGEVRGVNLGDSIQGLFTGLDLMLTGDDAEKLIARSIALFPYIQHALAANAVPTLALPADSSERTRAVYSGTLELPPAPSPELAVRVPREAFSSELRSALSELRGQALAREIQWRKELGGQVERTAITAEAGDQAFLQAVCDYLAQAYEMPQELWPRCRIAATLEPNAYAYPGGDIFFTAGLLGILGDLDSVMLVLGHEIGHVLGRHTTHRMPVMNTVVYSANALAIAGSVFSLGAGWGELGSVTFLNWFPKSMATSQLASVATSVFVRGGLAALMAHSRSAEWQADRFGQQSAYASGASLEAMARGWSDFTGFFKRYYDLDDSFWSRIMASHPDGDERHEELLERSPGLEGGLSAFHASNRLDRSFYDEYRKIHEAYRPLVHAFGRETGNKGKAPTRATRYTLDTLSAPGGQCVTHALGR